MTSTCAKCGQSSFHLQEKLLPGANNKIVFVQCTSCGAPIGVLESRNSGELLSRQAKEIADLKAQLSKISADVRQVLESVRRR